MQSLYVVNTDEEIDRVVADDFLRVADEDNKWINNTLFVFRAATDLDKMFHYIASLLQKGATPTDILIAADTLEPTNAEIEAARKRQLAKTPTLDWLLEDVVIVYPNAQDIEKNESDPVAAMAKRKFCKKGNELQGLQQIAKHAEACAWTPVTDLLKAHR